LLLWLNANHLTLPLSCAGHPQIEHHLFPNLNPMLYPQMAQRVRAICAAHKPHAVRYQHYDTLYDALAATLRRLQRLGNPKSAYAKAHLLCMHSTLLLRTTRGTPLLLNPSFFFQVVRLCSRIFRIYWATTKTRKI
jgi:hypothetical protein